MEEIGRFDNCAVDSEYRWCSNGCRQIHDIAGASNTIVPSPAEQVTLKKEIEEINDEIDALDEEIARLSAIRRGKSVHVGILSTAIAPHERLPVEVLGVIFSHTLPSSDPEPWFLSIPHGLSTRASPWNLRQICSSWRNAALSNTNLWNRITFFWGGPNNRPYNGAPSNYYPTLSKHFTIASQILPQSSPIHLDLRLRDDVENCADIIEDFLQGFVAQRRTQVVSLRLSVKCSHEAFWPLFVESSMVEMPNLQALRLSCGKTKTTTVEDLDATWFDPCHKAFDSAARLSALRFLGGLGTMKTALAMLAAPWAPERITYLELHYREISSHLTAMIPGINWAEFCESLRACKRLATLILKFANRIPSSTKTVQVVLPKLTSLTAQMYPPTLLDSFTLPSLKSLNYRSGDNMGIDQVIGLLDQSQCRLTSFIETSRSRPSNPHPICEVDWDRLIKFLEDVQDFETETLFRPIDMAWLSSGEILPSAEFISIAVVNGLDAFESLQNRITGAGMSPRGLPRRLRQIVIAFSYQGSWYEENTFPSVKLARTIAEKHGSSVRFDNIFPERAKRRIVEAGGV